jgi:hypothetical protein
MYHPLAPNLSEFTDQQLHEKYNELMSKINQAYKFGPTGAIPQMQLMQAHFQEEIHRRNAKQLEEMQSKTKDFNKIIDIK